MATSSKKVKAQENVATSEINPQYAAKIKMLKDTLASNNTALNTQKAATNKNYNTEVGSQNAANIKSKSNFTNANVSRGIGNTPMVSTGINEMSQINNKYVGAINKRRSSALNNIDDRLKLSQKSYDNTASTMATNKGIEINNLARNYADKQVAKEYQAGRDSVSDNHWTSGFNHTKNRDNVADSHYNSEKATDNSRYNDSVRIAAQKLATDNSRYNDSTRIAAQKLATDNSRYNDKTTIAAQKLKTDNARYDATTKLKAQAVITDNEHYEGNLKAAADKIANSPASKKGADDINNLLNNKGAYAKLTYDERLKKLDGYGTALSKKDDASSKYLLGLVNAAKETLNNELSASHQAMVNNGDTVTTGINPLTGKAQIILPHSTAITPSKSQTNMMLKKAKDSDDKTATIKANLPMLTGKEIEATIPKPAEIKMDYLNQLLQPKNTVNTATESSPAEQTNKVLPYKNTVDQPAVKPDYSTQLLKPSATANKPLPDEKNPEMAISYRDKKFSTTDIKAMNAAIDKETNPFKKAGLKLTQNLGYLLDTPDRNSFINRALETGRSSATGGSYKSNGKSTGNGLIDFAADVIGSAGGFSALESQGAIKLGQISTTAENTIAKLTGKTMGNYAVNKAANKAIEYGVRAASTGTEFAGINATETAMQGGNLKETAQSATKGFISGALWGAGGKALGEAGNKIANSKFSTSIKTELTSKVLKTKGYSEVVPESGYWVKTAERSKGKTSLMVGKPKVESVFVENSNYVDANNVRIPKWKMQLIDKIGTTKEKTQLKDILSQYKEGMKDAPKETNNNGDINPKSTVNNRNPNINNADPNIQDVNFKDANVKDTNVAINNPAFDVNKTINIKGMGDLKVVSKQNGKVSLKHEDGSVLNMSEDDLNQLSSEGKYEQPKGEDESVQPNHDEINQAQGLAQTANNLENMSQQKNDIMEATKRKVIQINRNNAQRVLNKVQKDATDKPISDVDDNSNIISTPQNNIQHNASNEGLNSIDDIYKNKNIINNTIPEKEINQNDEYGNGEQSNDEQDAINQEFNNIEANTPVNENAQQNANSKDLNHIADTSKMMNTADYNNGISDSNEMKSVKVNSIGVDPKRFQFKEETDSKTGTSDKLKGTNKFIKSKAGAITVWQDNQGKNWVINGHHRVELAQRTNTDNINALLLKESDGYTAEKARETGAMQNIAEGQGTAKDAAQVFRDGNYTIEDLKKEGLSTKDKSIEKGYNIAQLNDRLYSHVVNKNFNYDKASLIGKEFPKGTQENEANQNAVMDYVQQNNPNESELNEAIYMIKGSHNGMVNDVEENEQMSLDGLGTNNVMGSNFASKMKLISELKHTLVSNKNVFNKAIKNSGILSEAGNVLNAEGNTDKKAMLDNVIKVIDQGKGKKGDPVNDILNTYATKIGVEGMNNKAAVGHVTTEIIDYMGNNDIIKQINNPTNETDGQIDMFGGNKNGNVEQGNNKISIETKGNEQTSPGTGISEGETTGTISKEIENNIPFNDAIQQNTSNKDLTDTIPAKDTANNVMTETPMEPLKEDLSSREKVDKGLIIGDKVNLKRWGNLEVIDSKNENSVFVFKNEKGNEVKLSTNAIKRLADSYDKVVPTIKSTADNRVISNNTIIEPKVSVLSKNKVIKGKRFKGNGTTNSYQVTVNGDDVSINLYSLNKKQGTENISLSDYLKQDTESDRQKYLYNKDIHRVKSEELDAPGVTDRNLETIHKAITETLKDNGMFKPTFADKVKNKKTELPIISKKGVADTADSFTYSKDDINYDTIKNAYRMISHTPENRAKSMQKQYVSHMKEIQDNLSKYAETPEQKSILNDSLIKYKNKYMQLQNSILAATSRTASPMITGPAKFPVARNNKAMETEHRRTVEFLDFIEKAQKSIKKKILNGRNIDQNSSAEYKRLENEVMSTISTLKGIENGSGYNASSFKTGLSGMLKRSANNGYTDEVKKALELVKTLEKEHLNKPIFAKNNSIWDHAEKAALKIEEAPTGEVSVTKYDGAEISNNYDAERMQILFDVKPPAEVTQALSKEGWHYSRANSAWQRKITSNSERSAKNIVSQFYKEIIVEKSLEKLPTLKKKKKEVKVPTEIEKSKDFGLQHFSEKSTIKPMDLFMVKKMVEQSDDIENSKDFNDGKKATRKHLKFLENSTLNSDAIDKEIKGPISDKLKTNERNATYVPISNNATWNKAWEYINENNINYTRARADIERLESMRNADDTANAEAILLKIQQEARVYKSEGNVEMANIKYDEAVRWSEAMANKLKRGGQAIQAAAMVNKLSPEGILRFTIKKVNEEMSENDKKLLNDTANKVKKEMDKINNDTANNTNVTDKLVENVLKDEKVKKAIKSLTPSDLLAMKISSHARESKSKNDPITNMINTLYKVAKETLPVKQISNRNPMDFVVEAINSKEEYFETWDKAREIVSKKFEGNEKALSLLDEYFDQIIDKPFSDTHVRKAIDNTLKTFGTQLSSIVKEHYSKLDTVGGDIKTTLLNNYNLDAETAEYLSSVITKEWGKATSEKKSKILDNLIKVKVKSSNPKATFFKKIIKTSNLGGFTEDAYRDSIAGLYKIPRISAKTGENILNMANNLQELGINTEKLKQDLHKLNKNKTQSNLRSIENINKKIKDNERLLRISKNDLLDYVDQQIPSTFLRKVNSLQIINLLVNTKTASRNIVGNKLAQAQINVKDVIATALDKVISLGTGKRTAVLPNLKVQTRGEIEGHIDNWKDFIQNKDSRESSDKLELEHRKTFRKGPLGQGERLLGLFMNDGPAKNSVYQDEMRKQEKLAKLNGKDFDTNAAIEEANSKATIATFNDTNKMSDALSTIQRKLNADKEWGLGSILFRFARTPINIIKTQIDYSPYSVLKGVVIAARQASSNKETFDQKEFVDNMAKGLTGIGVLFLGGLLNSLGLIIPNDDDDYDKEAMDTRSGTGAFRVNVSAFARLLTGSDTTLQKGDNLVSIDWAVPFSTNMIAGVIMNYGIKNDIKNSKLVSAENLLSNFINGANTITELPMLQGIKTVVQSKDLGTGLLSLLTGIPQTMVPFSSALNQFKQLTDNKTRETYDPSKLKTIQNRVVGRLPLLSNTLPQRINTVGEGANTYQNDSNGLINVFFNPSFTTKYEPDDLAAKAYAIQAATGSVVQFPRLAAKTITTGGKKVKLTTDAYIQYQQMLGQGTVDIYSAYMGDDDSDETANNIKNDMTKLNSDVKEKVLDLMGVAPADTMGGTTTSKKKSSVPSLSSY